MQVIGYQNPNDTKSIIQDKFLYVTYFKGELSELKYLSKRRKRNQLRYRQYRREKPIQPKPKKGLVIL